MTVAKDNPQNEGDVTIIKPVLPEKLPLLKPGHEAAARHRFCGLPEVIFAGGIYCMASTGMVLLNKAVLSSFHFNSANAILLFQCFLSVVCVYAGRAAGVFKLEPITLKLVLMWAPVNLIFVGMLATSFYAVKALNVAMATVLKYLTNIFILAGDYYFYNRTYGLAVWGSVGLMIVSAIAAGATDLTFNAYGYFWALVNCGFTAAYSLYLRGTMDRVKAVTATGEKLNEASMCLINNLLSMPLVLVLMFGQGELSRVWTEPDLFQPGFQIVTMLSGLIAFGLSFTALWFLGSTTPTIYSLVGSLNKVPQAIIGLVAFHAPWTPQNLASIGLGLAAGVLFVLAKSR